MSTYTVSWPPSTNSLWRAYRGRNILSRQARLWAETAAEELMAQGAKPVIGPVIIDIELNSPHNRPYDPDNRIKAIFDLLVKNDIIEDDSNKIIKCFSVHTDTVGDFHGARITIKVPA